MQFWTRRRGRVHAIYVNLLRSGALDSPEELHEARLVQQLLHGSLDAVAYRSAMARLAQLSRSDTEGVF